MPEQEQLATREQRQPAFYQNPHWWNVCSVRPNSELYGVLVELDEGTDQLSLGEIHRCVIKLISLKRRENRSLVELKTGTVFCDQELENILKTKVIHVKQVEAAIQGSLYRWREPPSLCHNYSLPIVTSEAGNWRFKIPPAPTALEPRYFLSDRLRTLFLSVGAGGDPGTRVYTFPQGLALLNNYIFMKRALIVDYRNLAYVLVEKDPLGAIFGVKAFHSECDGPRLLQRHMSDAVVTLD